MTVPALGMARWDAVSTVSTTGNEAVADTAETPEHAAVRAAAIVRSAASTTELPAERTPGAAPAARCAAVRTAPCSGVSA